MISKCRERRETSNKHFTEDWNARGRDKFIHRKYAVTKTGKQIPMKKKRHITMN